VDLPQRVDDLVPRYDLPRLKGQQPEQQPLLGGDDIHRALAAVHGQRSEHADA
jgi:hypothetical protein